MDPDDWGKDGAADEWPSDLPSDDRVPREWDDERSLKRSLSGRRRRTFGTRSVIAIAVGSVLVGIVIGNAANGLTPSALDGTPASPLVETVEPSNQSHELATEVPASIDRPSPAITTPPPDAIATGDQAEVIRVVDGDTIHALANGVDENVRIIGLDSPETSKPGTPVECFAKEATAAAKSLLSPGEEITLQSDPTQDRRDRFDRLLAHVVLGDGSLFAERMIAGGWAVHYVYDGVPSIFAEELAAAEQKARRNGVGLWSDDTCAGNEHAATARP